MADDVVELLTELQSLRADGSLSGEEFATAKRMLLGGLDGGSFGPAVVAPSPVAKSAPVGAPDSVGPEPAVDAPGSVPAEPGPRGGTVRPYTSAATAPTLGQPAPPGHTDSLVAAPSLTKEVSALPVPVVPAGATASPDGGGSRLTAPVLATVVAVLIVAVGGVAVVISSGPSSSGGGLTALEVQSPSAIPAPMGTAGASPDYGGSVSSGGSATGNLDRTVASDRATVDGIEDRWVPQLSAKRDGLVIDGRRYDAAAILEDHLSLRARYPSAVLLWSGDYLSFRSNGYWVTVLAQPAASSTEANRWCDANGFARDACYAKLVSRSSGPSGTSVYR
ncbi:MAG: hypothetical protein L0I76_32685 [Pseudonocardia sp.]|nr:hypothetical protein [Pseudonocardia sp.]